MKIKGSTLRIKIVKCVGPLKMKTYVESLWRQTMGLIFHRQNSPFLNWSLPTEEIFHVHAFSETQGLWVDSKSGQKSPWGHYLTRLVPNGRSHYGIGLVLENLCVFLPNQSEVCSRVLSCVLTRICTRSSVASLVCLGRATKLCSRWKVSVSAHNLREIDQSLE